MTQVNLVTMLSKTETAGYIQFDEMEGGGERRGRKKLWDDS